MVLLFVLGAAVYQSVEPQRAPAITAAARGPVETAAADILAHLGDVAVDKYGNQLSRIIARGVLDDTVTLDRLVDKTMPAGTECRLFVDNGHGGRRQLGGDQGRVAGETVSRARMWRPTWAYTLAIPSIDVVTPLQPLEVQGFAVARGSLVKEQGVPVQVTLRTDEGNYSKATLTSIRDSPTATLFLRNPAGSPALSHLEPLLGFTNTTVLNLTGTTSLPSPTTFEVPQGVATLEVDAAFAGSDVDYVATFSNGLLSYPLVVPGPGTYALTIPDGTAGTWTFTGNGNITGDARTRAAANLTVTAVAPVQTADWTFVLIEESGKALPAGTNVTVRFPHKFTGLTNTNPAQAGWRNIVVTEDDNLGKFVTVELDTPLAGASREFTIHAAKPGASESLYLVQAALGNGTEGHATFLLAKPTGVPLSTNPIQRSVYLNTPAPMAPDKNTTWGLLFTYPSLLGSGSAEHVTQIDIEATGNETLFGNVTGQGWTRLDGSHLRWVGDRAVGANRYVELLFTVQAANRNTTWEPALRLPVEFATGDRFELPDRTQPYVYAAAIPPAELTTQRTWGYLQPELSGVPPRGTASYDVTWVNRGLRTDGTANYTVSTFTPLTALLEATRAGLARSQVSLSTQEAHIGEVFNLSVDFRGLLDEVTLVPGQNLTGWNVEVSIYDPSQPFVPFAEMVPSYRGEFGANGSLALRPYNDTIPNPLASNFSAPLPADISSVASATIPFMAPRQAFYGPHAIVAQANFVVNDVLGNNILQSARLLAVVDIVPDLGQSGATLYWTSLECWLPDW